MLLRKNPVEKEEIPEREESEEEEVEEEEPCGCLEKSRRAYGAVSTVGGATGCIIRSFLARRRGGGTSWRIGEHFWGPGP